MSLPEPYYQDEWVTIYHGDCREILPELPKVDLVLTDPPYGTTACEWDTDVDFVKLWEQLGDTTVIMTAVQPFSSRLVLSNLESFRYEWIWEKTRGVGFLNIDNQPLRVHEHILVFSKGGTKFNPQKTSGKVYKPHPGGSKSDGIYGNNTAFLHKGSLDGSRYPRSVQTFKVERGLHPTQKPRALMDYLIATYTDGGGLILDPFLGSGTTAYCAKRLNRKCIGIEIEEKYCEIAAKRCSQGYLI